ncbi:MAG: class I SAM-dependent methyltransferase [Gammaproteobacteria bacterium]|nr:class I SAM-dependent methyltransferase [Gammaproteobacteria bacterium]
MSNQGISSGQLIYKIADTGETGDLDTLLSIAQQKTHPAVMWHRGVPVFSSAFSRQSPQPAAIHTTNTDVLYQRSPASGSLGGNDPDAFLNFAETNGWKKALEKTFGDTSPGLLRAIAPNRTAWTSLFDIEANTRALDIGAGTGGVSCRLGKECHAVALDKSPVNAVFMQMRADQEKLANFQAVCADAVTLPFNDNQFDIVSMIGSFEWIPTSWPDKDPLDVHKQTLSEVWRVLKPGGGLFLAIENRKYLGYLFEILEPHTGLKNISFMERDRAKQLSLDLRNKPFLEYTYTRTELLNLLAQAHFENTRAYWLTPDYSTPNYIIPLDNEHLLKYFIEERLNPWSFTGARAILYKFFRMLEPAETKEYVEFFGFLAYKPT